MNALSPALAFTAIYFCWMDVATYVHLQRMPLLPHRHLNISSREVFSPFSPLTVKQLMQSPVNHYVEETFGHWVVSVTSLADSVTPNLVSLMGVACATLSARMLAADSLRVRQLGVLVYKVRDFLDSVDGWIARERSGEVLKMRSGTTGYYVDGYCDGAAVLFVFYGTSTFIAIIRQVKFRHMDVLDQEGSDEYEAF